MNGAATRKLRVGVLLNPVAGLGGSEALKGSDDVGRVAALVVGLTWGDEVRAFDRGVAAVQLLDPQRLVLVTAPGVMGEEAVKRATLLGGPVFEIVRVPGWNKSFGTTTAEDTRVFAQRLQASAIDLLLFVGGDGTALDVVRAVGADLPVLGVPAGVKMFSPVFAQTAEMAAHIVNRLVPGFPTAQADVVDLDEASYTRGAWIVRGQAVASVPADEGVQAAKGAEAMDDAAALADLVAWFREHVRPGVSYVLGAGSTVGAIKTALGGGTPLGVDVWRDGAWIVVDGGEQALLGALGPQGDAEIVVSPTGAQGALLGRGTGQIGPAVLDRVGVANVHAVATPQKLVGLQRLFVDTGDTDLDGSFPPYVKVRTDGWTEKVFPLARGASLG